MLGVDTSRAPGVAFRRIEGRSRMHTHHLHIAGQSVTVRAAAAPAYVNRLAADLDARVRAVGDQGAGPMGAVIVAALAMAALENAMEARDDALRARVEQALADD